MTKILITTKGELIHAEKKDCLMFKKITNVKLDPMSLDV